MKLPALATALHALCSDQNGVPDEAFWRRVAERWAEHGYRAGQHGVERHTSNGSHAVWRWIHDERSAVASLVERELLPERWLDVERAPEWVCRVCEGDGWIARPTGQWSTCRSCDAGSTPWPASHADLLAVVSRGPEFLTRVEAVVAETWPSHALVWMPRPAESLRVGQELRAAFPRHGQAPAQDIVDELSCVFACHTLMARRGDPDAWPEACPFDETYPDAGVRESLGAIRAAWKGMRELARLDAHMLLCDAGAVTIGVEALE